MAKVQQALAADPEMIEGYTRLGNIHTKAGRHAEAIAAYQQALALDPEHLLSTYNLALAYRAAGKIDEAIVGLRAHAAARPAQRPGALPARRHLHAAGPAGQGARRATKGLALDVDRPPFLVKLGEAHLELKRYDEAEKVLKEAVALRARRAARAIQPGAGPRAARQRRRRARRLRGRGGDQPRATTVPSSTSASCC